MLSKLAFPILTVRGIASPWFCKVIRSLSFPHFTKYCYFISYNVSKKTAIHIFIELQFLLLHKFKNVINIDCDHQYHKCDKQLINCLLINFLIDRTSTDSSGDTTCNHKDQYSDLEIRYTSWNDCWNNACNLREENNVQRVFCCNFCWHREKEK